ncbi:hypothetical protein Ssi03_21890 [Sphaerisporangium siamense]|uniref:Phosphopantetheinyl transferase n=1 Tax=Sphaerisporangium siamense TaxID=795645 RepID=A0A7W7D7U6_9ACTN|nr:4'-phosphopantetheinyl transferase superfamily protein [Sphaerisporangium siamense]MBB4701893.1 phosphopantetheinyl transferase [Sphaerisporangium siamense]GII84199.1 hypothetical protein Ssi03_21890 [Sphaerisporangium siamense]
MTPTPHPSNSSPSPGPFSITGPPRLPSTTRGPGSLSRTRPSSPPRDAQPSGPLGDAGQSGPLSDARLRRLLSDVRPPGPQDVHVWTFPADEQARYAAAHFVTRRILGRYLDLPAEAVEFQYGENGKPALRPDPARPDLRFNLSHSGPLALLAVAVGRDVGVDVERVRSGVSARAIAERRFDREGAEAVAADPGVFFRLWTRKEACVKASGGRLGWGMAIPVSGPVATGTPRLPGPWRLYDLPAPEGYVAALALPGPHPAHVTTHPLPEGPLP